MRFVWVRSNSFHPWCWRSFCLVVGNLASSLRTSLSEARPVDLVTWGNLPVCL